MITLAQKNTALKSWIMSVIGFDTGHVILKNAGGPRPLGDYVVFDSPFNVQNVGTDFVSEEVTTEGAITLVHMSTSQARVGIDIFSYSGAEYLEMLKLSVGTSFARVALFAGDLTFIRRTPIIWIPEYDDTDPVNRYHADFYFYTQNDLVEADFELQKISAKIELVDPVENTRALEFSVGEIDEPEEDTDD